jgi:hypothetical protein
MDIPYVVRAVNTGPTPFVITHNRERLVIPANGDRVVPWEAMISLWGDPQTSDNRQQTRQDYSLALRGGFGWFTGLNAEEEWTERRPPIEWWTLEGERLWTVLDDPTGEHARNATPQRQLEQGSDAAFLMETIRTMQTQMEQLQSALDQRNEAQAAAAGEGTNIDSGELPKPDPSEPAVKTDVPVGPRLRGK